MTPQAISSGPANAILPLSPCHVNHSPRAETLCHSPHLRPSSRPRAGFLHTLRLPSTLPGGTGFPACARTRGGTPRLQRARRVVPLRLLVLPTYRVLFGGTSMREPVQSALLAGHLAWALARFCAPSSPAGRGRENALRGGAPRQLASARGLGAFPTQFPPSPRYQPLRRKKRAKAHAAARPGCLSAPFVVSGFPAGATDEAPRPPTGPGGGASGVCRGGHGGPPTRLGLVRRWGFGQSALPGDGEIRIIVAT